MKKLSRSIIYKILRIVVIGNIFIQLILAIDIFLNHWVKSVTSLVINLIIVYIFQIFIILILQGMFNRTSEIYKIFQELKNDKSYLATHKNEIASLKEKLTAFEIKKGLYAEKKKVEGKIHELNIEFTKISQAIEKNIDKLLKMNREIRFLIITSIITLIAYHFYLFSVFYSYFYNQNSTELFLKITNSISSQFYLGVLTSSSLFLTISITFVVLTFSPKMEQIKIILSYFFASFLFIFSSLFLSIIGLSLSESLSMINPIPFQTSIFLVTLSDFFLGFILIFIAVYKAYTSQLKLD